MGSKKMNKSKGAVGHGNDEPKRDLLRDMFEAVCIMESVVLMLKHYKNELGDDSETAWYGLSLVLAGVLATLVDAKDAIEYGSPVKIKADR